MNTRLVLSCILLVFTGCATFKELEPIPPVDPAEKGFIELRNDQEKFLLEREKQYFIKFPRPADDHFYIVLETAAKKRLHNYLTATFDDGNGPLVPIADESSSHDSMSVFAIDTSHAWFYWVIDSVFFDVTLNLQYRYVPQWRYVVENKYDEYRRMLEENTVDRSNYNAMGPEFAFSAFDVSAEQKNLRERNMAVSDMNNALAKLEGVFPANIASSNDTMYQRYVGLNNDTKDEMRFQSDYDAVLKILQGEAETHGDFNAFMDRAPEFIKFLDQKSRFRAAILEYEKSVYVGRLKEALPVYDAQVRKVNDLSTIELKPPMDDVAKFYQACDESLPAELQEIRDYADDFNGSIDALKNANQQYEETRSAIDQKLPWPKDTFYPELLAKLDKIEKLIPEFTLGKYENYKVTASAALLAKEIRTLTKKINDLRGDYRRAAKAVEMINALLAQKFYKSMIPILRDNRDLPFLIAQYPDIDELVLKDHIADIREHIGNADWKRSEDGLSDLLADKEYLNVQSIAQKKLESVRSMEGEVFDKVKKLSFDRIDAFIAKHETTIDDVPALYADTAFLPVYTLTFSSESPARLAQKRKTIDDYLSEVKYYRFPEGSIKPIFRELTRAPQDSGVERARAILQHAKYYKGKDRTVRNIIDECNPTVAKTLAKPKDYRRLFVLPVNEAAKSSNEYMFRVNVKIQSDAKFPVYDVNIKVPKEIAEKAGPEQWFTEMTLNKKVVKTEGHMRVVAPTADNEYEAQITPVQMEKDRDNIVEIRFKYPLFKLFEVSIMAQVPLIRKN
ncbi:MAG: hypothetical protein WBD36_10900 [Bacteroidota bacterium]